MVTKQSFPLVKTENNTELSPNEPKNLYFVHMVHIHFVYTAVVKEWGPPPPPPPPQKSCSRPPQKSRPQSPTIGKLKSEKIYWFRIWSPHEMVEPPSHPHEKLYDYATLYLAMLTSSTSVCPYNLHTTFSISYTMSGRTLNRSPRSWKAGHKLLSFRSRSNAFFFPFQ